VSASPADTDLRAILFHGFADRSRLRILEVLTAGEHRVTDIVETTALTQPNVSTHLACLHDCGLVERQRRGREVHYRLAEGVSELLAVADSILARTGGSIGSCSRYGRGTRLEAA
jgi:DNA-binding transcriptional ArsR family regulator